MSNNFYGMNYQNYGMGMNPNMQQPPSQFSEPPKKERLRIILSPEEKSFYGNLFLLADKTNKGKLEGRDAAQFLKKSGLGVDVLKKIWMTAAQTDPNFLEKEEFYIALRLIALAQNNMDVSENSIRTNTPVGLPNLDLREKKEVPPTQNSTPNVEVNLIGSNHNDGDVWKINDIDLKKYTELFNKNKESDSRMTMNKALEMFTKAKVSIEKIKKIFAIVPIQDKNSLSLSEFKVIIHLIYKYYENIEVPFQLPECLSHVLYDKPNHQLNSNQSLDFSNIVKNTNNMKISSPIQNPNVNQDPNSFLNNNPNTNNFSLFDNPVLNSQINPVVEPTKNNDFVNPITSNYPNNQFQNKGDIQGKLNQALQSNQLNLQEVEQENRFLNRVLDEDTKLLENLLDDINKVNKNIEQMNEKNKILRDKILDTRRKINIERDNLSKSNNLLQNKTNEFLSTQNEFERINEERNQQILSNQNQNTNTTPKPVHDIPKFNNNLKPNNFDNIGSTNISNFPYPSNSAVNTKVNETPNPVNTFNNDNSGIKKQITSNYVGLDVKDGFPEIGKINENAFPTIPANSNFTTPAAAYPTFDAGKGLVSNPTNTDFDEFGADFGNFKPEFKKDNDNKDFFNGHDDNNWEWK